MEHYLHSSQVLKGAVLLADRGYVELHDPLFAMHGVGPRYALVQNATVHGRALSYAMLDLPGTGYDLITDHDQPRELGTFEQLVRVAGDGLHAAIDATFKADDRTGNFGSKQQLALALIRAVADGTMPADQLGLLRTARWAKQYELRAWWICKNRVEAYAATINWPEIRV